MEAPILRAATRGWIVALLLVQPCLVRAAGYRTPNFTVDAPTPRLAKEIGDAAEKWRKELSVQWLEKELPRWSRPCPIKAQVAPNLGAGGATSFVFDNGHVYGWRMNIQGSRERILDSVLPHEVTHTIFASHFRRPIPRWADEGACTTVEHVSEISKQEKLLIEFLQTRRGIPFSNMFAMKEYPQDVLPLYAQGHSLCQFLISQSDKQAFLDFLASGMEHENWPLAVREHYGYPNLLTLQNSWLNWIRQGRPDLKIASDSTRGLLASNNTPTRRQTPARTTSAAVVRGQDPASSAASQVTAKADAFTGLDGPMVNRARADSKVEVPWTGAGSPVTQTAAAEPQAQATAGSRQTTAETTSAETSVYDARNRGTILR